MPSNTKPDGLTPTRWGEWELDRSNLTLVHTTGYGYAVDLEDCTSSAQVLDWICQIASKKWADPKIVGGLVEAVNDLLEPQANLCSFGADKALPKERIGPLVLENELDVRAGREMKRLEQAGEVPWKKDSHGLTLTNFGEWGKAHDECIEKFRVLRDGPSAKKPDLPRQRITFEAVDA